MASEPIVTVKLEVDDKKANQTFKSLADTAEREGKKIADSLSGGKGEKNLISEGLGLIKGNFGKIAGVAGLAAAAMKVFQLASTKGVEEVIKMESAVNALNFALENNGRLSPKVARDFALFADAIERTTVVGADLVLKSAAMLETMTNLDKEGLKRATTAAINLSQGLGIDLEQAVRMVGRSADGSVTAFKRLGISINEGDTRAQTFENTLSTVEKKFGGAAEKKVNSYAGSLKQLGNAYDGVLEGLGRFITESFLAQKSIQITTSLLRSVDQFLNPDKGTLPEQIARVTSELQKLEALRSQYAKEAKGPDRFGFSNASFRFLKDTEAKIDVVRAQLERLKADNAKEESNKNIQTFGLRPDELKQIYENGKLIGLTQEQVLYENYASQQNILTQLRENDLISQQDYDARVLEMETQLQDNLTKLAADGANKRTDIEKRAAATGAQLGQMARQALANGISFGVQSMVKSFLLGEKSSKSFLQSVLGMMGDLAVGMGEVLILAGLGMQSLFALSGGAALAAGIGLVALGTVLKSFAGGAEAPNGGGGSGDGAFQASGGNLIDQQERAEPETRVVVNVQGNVFDSEETGLRISNILKEASLNNNVKASVFT